MLNADCVALVLSRFEFERAHRIALCCKEWMRIVRFIVSTSCLCSSFLSQFYPSFDFVANFCHFRVDFIPNGHTSNFDDKVLALRSRKAPANGPTKESCSTLLRIFLPGAE